MGPLPRKWTVAPLLCTFKVRVVCCSLWSCLLLYNESSFCLWTVSYRRWDPSSNMRLCVYCTRIVVSWSLCQVSVMNSAKDLPEIYALLCSSLISCAIIKDGKIPIKTMFQTWLWPRKRMFVTQMRWSVTNTPVENGSPQTRHFLSRDMHCHGRGTEVFVCHIC